MRPDTVLRTEMLDLPKESTYIQQVIPKETALQKREPRKGESDEDR